MAGGPEATAAAGSWAAFTGEGTDLEDFDRAALIELARGLAERNTQLQQALASRIVIEQAKGVLAERFRLAPDDAFELLRRAARNHRIRVHALAAKVVEQPETPAELTELVPR